ncbi:MAG: DM13 domain-containing protein [Hyphomicrobiales bacterium]|nr:DM13 domain-containing protein [Hyphomicrobiales bacterium]
MMTRLFAATALALALSAPALADPRTGDFSGRSGHKTAGRVELVKTPSGYEVRLGANFRLDGAPGPYVGFGNGGVYDKSSELGKLRRLNGAQVYAVPAGVDPSKYSEVFIWCKPYSVPLGVARLN